MPFPKIIGNYYLYEKLGSGFSGTIFHASHIFTGHAVALKVQDVDHECPTNRYERHIYPYLQGGLGMPTLWAAGVQGQWDYLALDLLGPSLDRLLKQSGMDCLDLRSVCCIGMQVILRLEFMHSRGVLHRDIQLGNCVIGPPGTVNENVIYMIDFGFSKLYLDPYTRKHISDRSNGREFVGNYWFSSVAVHCRGKVPSRRDDLEAVALMLIHLLTPRGLPWTRNGVPKTDQAHARLKREKQSARPEDLCCGLPEVFEEFLRYCRRLKFAERPSYGQWVGRLMDLMVEEGLPTSEAFIWPPVEPLVMPRQVQLRAKKAPVRAEADPDVLAQLLMQLGLVEPDEKKRKVFGERQNQNDVARPANNIEKKGDAEKAKSKPVKKTEVFVLISSGRSSPVEKKEKEEQPPPQAAEAVVRRGRDAPKAERLRRLTRSVSKVRGSVALSELVSRFAGVLEGTNSSRMLTREGCAFLDALGKRLASDPSPSPNPKGDGVPVRGLRVRGSSDKEQIPAVVAGAGTGAGAGSVERQRLVKAGVVARLRREVVQARSHRQLGKMVAEFVSVTDQSAGKTITKDGFAFLNELATRLRNLGPV